MKKEIPSQLEINEGKINNIVQESLTYLTQKLKTENNKLESNRKILKELGKKFEELLRDEITKVFKQYPNFDLTSAVKAPNQELARNEFIARRELLMQVFENMASTHCATFAFEGSSQEETIKKLKAFVANTHGRTDPNNDPFVNDSVRMKEYLGIALKGRREAAAIMAQYFPNQGYDSYSSVAQQQLEELEK